MPQFEDDKTQQRYHMIQQIHHYQELIQHRNHQIVRWFIILLVLSAVGTTAISRTLVLTSFWNPLERLLVL